MWKGLFAGQNTLNSETTPSGNTQHAYSLLKLVEKRLLKLQCLTQNVISTDQEKEHLVLNLLVSIICLVQFGKRDRCSVHLTFV